MKRRSVYVNVRFSLLFQDKQTTVLNGAKKQLGRTTTHFHSSRSLLNIDYGTYFAYIYEIFQVGLMRPHDDRKVLCTNYLCVINLLYSF